jgi:YjjI family glycine radical enzyme
MENVLSIIMSKKLTYEQKVLNLAQAAEDSTNVLSISKETQEYKDAGVICDLNEGNAPYKARYILPDYEKFMKQGSKFLGLNPPKDIWEAVNNLLILYKNVPSVTSFPVYAGNLDTLLEPFIKDETEAYHAIKLLLIHMDRTLRSSFCHANIGPKDTVAGRLILKAERELQCATPSITLKFNKETSDDFAIDAINTALVTAKPSFANHDMFIGEFGEGYGIASCYNGLSIGGGSYTLVRLNLAFLAKRAKDKEDFINILLSDAVQKMADFMDERIRFLVEESGFFETSFLAEEGLISRNKFSAMFGIVGLAECVNYLIKPSILEEKFGHGKVANELGYLIIKKLDEEVSKHFNKYCEATGGRFLLHAQVGIDSDKGVSPGCRIPIGEEPELSEQIIQSSVFHKYFPSGISDVFSFDSTVKQNPAYVLDIIKGAFKEKMRYFPFYSNDSDVVRITGYLAKRSEMEKLDSGKAVLIDNVVLGLGAAKNQKVLDRKVRG